MMLSNLFNNNFYNALEDDNLKLYDYTQKNDKYIFSFSGTDSDELFKRNLEIKPKNWFYRKNPVKYTVNSYGYRTEEFDKIDWSESIVMFGCSFIFGTGVTDEHTIPYFLEKLSGRQVVNLGVGGSSIQTALYNGIVLNNSKYLTPKFIIPFWTSLDRHQIYLKNKIENYGFWNFNESPLNSNKNHAIIQNLLNIKIFRSLWKNKTIYREYTLFSEQVDLINKMDDNISCIHLKCSGGGARDCGHNGPIENFKIAEKIYKSIKHFL